MEELKELFGPAFGPALEAHGRSFAERLREDEGFVAEACELFEEGERRGEFPVLSELLAGASPEEREEFFRSGWVREVLPTRRPVAREPWDHAPWYGNVEAYREDLYAGMALGHPDLRAFAQEWLDELARVGYYGMEEALGLLLKQQADDLSAMPGPLPVYGEAFPVRFEDTEQTVWIRLDGPRSTERGYREIVVSDEPLRTDTAILAALTSLEGRRLDVGRLRERLPELMPFPGESFFDRWKAALGEGREQILRDLRHHRALDYVLALLRYHRPGFDDLPVEERAGLVADACAHVNGFLETLRKLATFLEHGRPGRRGPTATRVTARDVTAAVLKDVDGLTYREIGDKFGLLLPVDFGHKGDHATVRKMVIRGRKVLEQALGAEGWRAHAEA
ncbi:MAG: hypothetical protein AB1425_04415, partial [Actinomycetota bacterium]